MNTTSAKLARAAQSLQVVLEEGHRGIVDAAELVIAGHARDQVIAGLATLQRHRFGGLSGSVQLQAADILRHPVRGMAEALRRRTPTGLHGPSPSDLAISPPGTIAAGWVTAANHVEAAVVDALRTEPVNPSSARLWTTDGSGGRPAAGSPVSADWSLAADVAAIAGTVTLLDDDLADAIERAANRPAAASPETASSETASPRTASAEAAGLNAAVHRLRDRSGDDLKLATSLVLQLAESGPLPDAYHLRPTGIGPVPVSSVWSIPAALERAAELLRTSPPLTGPQHRALAVALAGTADQLAAVAGTDLAPALRHFTSAQVDYAAVWARSGLGATGLGDWAAVRQVRAVADRLVVDSREWRTTPPDTAMVRHLRRATERLPGIAMSATANLRTGLKGSAYLAAEAPARAASIWIPATADCRARVRVERVGVALDDAAAQLRSATGPQRPLQPPSQATRPQPARQLLRAVLDQPLARPAHPALPPAGARGHVLGRSR